jgi:hypothetical protein
VAGGGGILTGGEAWAAADDSMVGDWKLNRQSKLTDVMKVESVAGKWNSVIIFCKHVSGIQ